MKEMHASCTLKGSQSLYFLTYHPPRTSMCSAILLPNFCSLELCEDSIALIELTHKVGELRMLGVYLLVSHIQPPLSCLSLFLPHLLYFFWGGQGLM